MDQRILRFQRDFAKMKEGGVTRPAMATVFLAYGCNFHCPGCHYNAENEHGWQTIDSAALLRRLAEARAMGLQAVNYSGGGEPLFHRNALDIFSRTYDLGLRVGTLTNGSRLLRDRELRELLFERNEFVRVSAYPETDLRATRRLAEEPHRAQLGLKLLVSTTTLEFNREVILFMRDAPWSYIEIKAERQSPDDLARWDAARVAALEAELKALSPKVKGSLQKEQTTHRCYLTPVHVFIDAAGDFLLCCYFHGRRESFRFGSIHDAASFAEIWSGEAHRAARASIDTAGCNRWDCRFFRYLDISESVLEGGTPSGSRHEFDADEWFI
jgi:MoaA/NifB/PqqE/SkfB family radical SAM enzyme